MAYVAVVKALYEYAAQDPETELSLKEDQICYVIEKEDADWWKAKLKDEGGQEGPIGLIPATYLEELPPMNTTRALFAYDSTSPEELSMNEDESLHVYSLEDDWLLVRLESAPSSKLGFVPRTYCQPLDESAAVAVPDAEEAEADIEEHRREEDEREHQREVAEKQRVLKLKDKVETWTISEMDGRKKKKGTLGVGNGAVFFASDTDKMGGVKQYNITELTQVSQPSSKNLELVFSSLAQPLLFHCGSSSNTTAIIAKLETSKEAAGEVLELTKVDSRGVTSEEDDYGAEAEQDVTPAAEPKTVRWAADAPASRAAGGESATVLYDFDAQGEDELTVKENETVTVVDKENDEWWSVRNASGQEGVVPAQYVQLNDGSAPAPEEDDHEEEARRQEEEQAAAANLEAERQRAAAHKAEERRAIERAARERQKQEEEDRRYAEELDAKEAAKAERRARRQQEEQRSQREYEMAKRREAARGLEPPKISKRPSAQDVSEVARSLPTKGKQAPIKPPENNRPKPTPGRTRVWSDKSGQFKVEAEYLGLNGNKIRLHKMNGVIIEVPLEKMATEDVQLIRRHEARRRAAEDDDNVPLGRQQRQQRGERSEESKGRSSRPEFEAPPAEAMQPQKPKKPRYDWFAFFLEAGCDMDDCTRYAANFERDRIDEEILPDLDASTIRSLGLKEGDVIRVRKVITSRYAKKTPEQEAQMKQDEEYARQLQEHENSGSKGPIPQPPPSLFTSSNGKLANNTRRGRPEKKSTGPEGVDPAAIAAMSTQLTGVTVSSPSPPPAPAPPAQPIASPAPQEKPVNLLSGFDDDAWTIKPSASKPASPAPPPAPAPPAPPVVATPPPANPTESLLAQIQAMRPPSTGISSNTTGGSTGNFDKYAAFSGQPQQIQQQRSGSAPIQPTPTGYNLGVQGSNQSMGQMQNGGFGQQGPRGPMAPVPANEALLNPLQPVRTGFVPTRGGQQQQQQGGFMAPQQTGFMPPQQTGMMPQATGYAAGFQQGYGGQQQQIQPNFTGFPGNFPQQSQTSNFNAIASMRPPEPQQNPDKFAPSNIFAAMKGSGFGKPEEEQPQAAAKYDSLRPLTTGYNGAPGGMGAMGGMMPQQTGMGMMQQQTGMPGMGGAMGGMGGMGGGMMQQQTGMGMGGIPGGMGGMGGYPGGYLNSQMTGFNPQQQGQQGQGYGYGQYR